MNLYRSFGNLLETWVAEGVPHSHTQEELWFGRADVDPATVSGSTLTPVSDMGISVRCESVDSGVELTSSDTSLPSPSCFLVLSMGNPETDPVVPTQREEDGLTPPSTSQTPVLSPPPSSASSPSPCTSPVRGAQSSRERSVALHCKVEQALQRTGPRSQSRSHTQEEPWFGRADVDPATVSGSTLTPVSDMGISVRSESVDSGVELTSSDTSLPSPSCFLVLSMGNPETDPVVPTQCEEDGLTPLSTSQTPVLSQPPSSASSPSPCTSPVRGAQSSREHSVALHCKVEQALQRTGPRSQSLKQSPSPQVVLRRQSPKSSSLVARQVTEDHTTSQRTGSFGRKSTSQQHTSGHIRRPLSLHHTLPAKIITKNHGDKKMEGLSPGLSYLERVCQMLEEIARLQKDNRGLQLEMDALLESKQSVQASESLFCDCKAIAEEPLSSEACEMNSDEHISTETQWQNNNENHDFRRRSASDTNVLLAHHLRMVKPNSRGQHVNINDLLEQAEDHENQEETDKQTHRKLNIETQRRDKTAPAPLPDSEKNCQQMQPSQKKASRHRLSQLFRRRRKSIPT